MTDVEGQPGTSAGGEQPITSPSALHPNDAKGKGPERIPMRERLKSTVLSAADSAERWRSRQRLGLGRQQTMGSDPQRMTIPEDSPDAMRERDEIDEEGEPSSATLASTFDSSSRAKHLGPGNALRLELPSTPKDPFTMSHNQTPGWQSPWAPHSRQARHSNLPDLEGVTEEEQATQYAASQSESEGHLTVWGRRQRKIRRFILHSGRTPLVSTILSVLS